MHADMPCEGLLILKSLFEDNTQKYFEASLLDKYCLWMLIVNNVHAKYSLSRAYTLFVRSTPECNIAILTNGDIKVLRYLEMYRRCCMLM